MPSGDWRVALWCCGRGFGKTRTGAEIVRHMVETGKVSHVTIASATASDVRDICVDGPGSGILSVSPPWFYPNYEPSKRRLTWPNGARATLISADEPDRARGLQHSLLWCDELAAWRYPEAWDQLMFGLRLGQDPRCIVTTTPRPSKLIKGLMNREGDDVKVIRGTSFDNQDNLPQAFFTSIIDKYQNSRLGEQEIYAKLLTDTPGSFVNNQHIDEARVLVEEVPPMVRTVVAVDPAVTSGESSDETGIVVAGLGEDGHVYILDDRTCKLSPEGWARRVVESYERWECDRVIAEVNNGGDLLESVLRSVSTNALPYKSVRASRGKHVRFEPVGSLFEQGKVHMVGNFPKLEDQVTMFTPGGYEGGASPDRADALCWAVTALVFDKTPVSSVWSI